MFLNRHRLDYWAQSFVLPFIPTSLFAAGVTGGWWDPADQTTTFKDVAGTVPATAAGDIVRRINDKSGNGNNLLETTADGNAPILRNSGVLWWLEFRVATASFMQAAFTFIQPHTRINAVQIDTWGLNRALFDGGAGTNQCTVLQNAVSPNLLMFAGSNGPNPTQATTGTGHVISEFWSGANSTGTIDNDTAATGDTGTNNPGGFTVGARASKANNSDMLWFGGVDIGRALSATETADCRTYFGNLAGITL